MYRSKNFKKEESRQQCIFILFFFFFFTFFKKFTRILVAILFANIEISEKNILFLANYLKKKLRVIPYILHFASFPSNNN